MNKTEFEFNGIVIITVTELIPLNEGQIIDIDNNNYRVIKIDLYVYHSSGGSGFVQTNVKQIVKVDRV